MADKYNFGSIEEVPLRDVWKGEASDFTPWLASEDGLRRLGNLIGRNLILVGTEIYIGKYRADIIAKDDNDEYYVIENKFETMDHDHLGKSIVYVAGYDPRPKHVIIIVEAVTPEHIAAMEMLNNITEDLDFTFLEIHARRIDKSPIVPFFEVKVQPDNWSKISRKNNTTIVDDNTYKAFFDAFQEYAKNNREFVDFVGLNPLTRANLGRSYMDLICKNGISFAISAVMRSNEIKTGIYIRKEHEIGDTVLAMLDDIKKVFGDELFVSDSKNLTINAKTTFDINNTEKWKEAFAWYCESVKKWRTVLEPVLK